MRGHTLRVAPACQSLGLLPTELGSAHQLDDPQLSLSGSVSHGEAGLPRIESSRLVPGNMCLLQVLWEPNLGQSTERSHYGCWLSQFSLFRLTLTTTPPSPPCKLSPLCPWFLRTVLSTSLERRSLLSCANGEARSQAEWEEGGFPVGSAGHCWSFLSVWGPSAGTGSLLESFTLLCSNRSVMTCLFNFHLLKTVDISFLPLWPVLSSLSLQDFTFEIESLLTLQFGKGVWR